MIHAVLTIFSVSTLIYLAFSLAELVTGRYRLRGVALNDWVVDFGTFAIGKSLIAPAVTFMIAALTTRLLPHSARSLAAVPWWLQFAAFVLCEDMVQYWYHRSVHTFPVLWPYHLAHHAAPYMGVRMSSRNSFLYQLLFPNRIMAGVLVYLGFAEAYVWYAAIKNVVTTAAHSELRWDAFLYRYRVLRPLAWIVQRTISTPATHFAHHARAQGDGIGHYSGNFGNLLFFWDVLFGTALISQQYPPAFGVPPDPVRGVEPWYVQIFYPLFRPRTGTATLPAPGASASSANAPSALGSTMVSVTVTIVLSALAVRGSAQALEVLPHSPPPFHGKMDPSRDKSVPDWPQAVHAPDSAPNIVLVLLDDVGFGASSAVGGGVETPTLERLAASGLRYNNFHVNAMCSPTRAALLTGRNNHQLGFGQIAESASGYPGYNTVWPRSAASIAEVLRQNGYSTAAFGKWHNTPVWEVSPVGPFDHWPTGLGFEYFYGFLSASTSQFEPSLYRNTVAVEPPATPAQGYHFTTDIANDAIHWLHAHDAVVPDKPFFVYFATGGTHSPHQVPQEWIDKFKGQFDGGWDQLRQQIYEGEKRTGTIPANADLSPRPKEIPAWDSLTTDQKRLVTRQMEVYAGFLAQTDHEVGRVLDAIRDEGKLDNTLVLYIVGDNGATMEGNIFGSDGRTFKSTPDAPEVQLTRADRLGGPLLSNNYAAGWAWALNAPFPWAKQRASHLGGITDALIVSWPKRIRDPGNVRGQFTHIIDVAPTLYQLAGIKPPSIVDGVKQSKLEGASFAATLNSATAVSGHTTQYFELVGNRGIYDHGWFAGRPSLLPWESYKYETADPDANPWELYNLNDDYSQAHNLAEQNPQKLKQLVALFDKEAWRNDVYPIAPHRLSVPSPADARTHFEYRSGVTRLPIRVVPAVTGRAHVFTADVDVPPDGAEGVIFAEGGRGGGFSLYVKNGRVVYENNSIGRTHERLVANETLPSGHDTITFQFAPIGNTAAHNGSPQPSGGHATLSLNGKVVAESDFAWFGGFGETFDVGSDLGSPVSDHYTTPFAFTGRINKVVLDLN